MNIYMDEGALDGDARLPSACAVVVGDVGSTSQKIENLIRGLSLQPSFRLERGYKRFQEVGFHYVEDNILAKERFKSILPRLDFEWWCSANLNLQVDDPYETLSEQFTWVATRILQKYRGKEVHFVFEQNERLRSQFPIIVQEAVGASRISSPGNVSFSVGTKLDRILSVADYCIALASQAVRMWMELCCNTSALKDRYQYRSYAEIEPLCSTLFAANYRRSISSRAMRLADHSFYEVAGVHAASCPRGEPA